MTSEGLQTEASWIVESCGMANGLEELQMNAREDLQAMVMKIRDDDLLVLAVIGDAPWIAELSTRAKRRLGVERSILCVD